MARLPTKYDLSGPESLRSGRKIAVQDTTAIGAGIAQAGAGLTALGDQLKQQENTLGLAQAESTLKTGLIDTRRAADEDPDYSTYGERYGKSTNELVNKAASFIRDPNLRQRWIEGAKVDAASTMAAIDAKADALGKQATIASIDETLEAQRRIYVDPNTTEEEKQKALSDIQGTIEVSTQTGIFTPDQADQRKQQYIRNANFSRAKLLAEADPTAITRPAPKEVSDRAAAAVAFFQSKGWTKEQAAGIVGNLIAESNLRTEARNPGDGRDGSDSIGLGQWNGPRAQALKQFAAANGGDWRDFNVQLAFVQHELEGSESAAAQALKNARDVHQATAAFAGYERPAGWSPDNPTGAHNFKGRLKFASQAAGMDPNPQWMKDLSPEEREATFDIAEAVERQRAAAEAADFKATQVATRDTYNLRIATNDPTLTPQDILSDARIDDGDKAALINTYNTARKDAFAGAEAVQAFANGTLQVDPYSSEGKKAVDFIGKEIEKSVPADRQQAVTESLVRQTGLVPQNTFNSIRGGLESQNVSEVVAAAQTASRIAQISPQALSRREGGASVQNVADDFGFYVNTLNLSPEQAAQKIMDMRDPAKQRERKALAPAAKEFVKQIENDDIGSMFDESWLPFNDPKVGFNEAQALGMQAEYQAIAEEQFYQANGNPDVAKNRAQQHMKRLYGVTELTGSKVVMKHPPERYWPPNTAVSGDPFQYAKQQLFQDLYAIDPEIERSKIQLVTTPETDAMIKRGEMPAYAVLYPDKNGSLQTMPGKLWRPDIANVERSIREQQDEAVKSAREQDQTYRENIIPGQDRDATLDNYLDGNPLTGQVQ
ncbi:phage tail tip lysozyme [Brucella sp. IR073]|uniref:phage tail tip lysozyme n=1 Tax=unclassified Brucella TaxID=2632610 RepID=UPI003B9804B8